MTAADDERDRRDARTVEITFALVLGVGTFLSLVGLGWIADHALRAALGASLEPFAPALAVTAALLGCGVLVGQLVRARRRGL